MENNFIYLDNASTTPLSENVLNIINSTYRNYCHNPSSTYELVIKCSTYLEKIRSKIAYIFEADPEDIIFTSGSSESTNIVFNNNLEKFKNDLIQKTTIALLPKDPRDERSVMLEIRAGAGGNEACIWAGDLARMYERYGQKIGWSVKPVSASE